MSSSNETPRCITFFHSSCAPRRVAQPIPLTPYTATMDDYDTELPLPQGDWDQACWLVIDAYFADKGLVRQQLDSFNEFIEITVQQTVKNHPPIELQPKAQYTSNDEQSHNVSRYSNPGLISCFADKIYLHIWPNLRLQALTY